MTKPRSLAIPGLVVALVLAVAACGGQPFPQASSPKTRVGTTPAAARAVLLAAVQRTNAAKTARFSVNLSMTGLGGDAPAATITGSGAMDLTRRRVSMKISGTGVGKVSVDMRVIGSTAYVNMGHGWVSQAVSATSTTTPLPTNYLDYLKGLGGTVRVAGYEKLRGDQTTRYLATIDFSRAAARLGDASGQAAAKQLLGQLGLTKIPVTIWVDDLGRMRKMTMTMDLSGLGSLAAKLGAPADFAPKMAITMEMYDFGAPVSVEVPSGAVKSTAPSGMSFCLSDTCSGPDAAAATAAIHEIQSDLRNALTTEKVTYTDNMTYTADAATLKGIEPSLDWGGKLKVVVGSSTVAADDVVCLSETSSGTTYSIADVATGLRAGTYYGTAPCPAKVTDATVATFGSDW